jgi:hypothetical protein
VARKVYDCCGGTGKHLPGCDSASPELGKPRGPRREKGKGGRVSRPGKNYGEKCPPRNPSAVRKYGKDEHWYRCSKCKRQLGHW